MSTTKLNNVFDCTLNTFTPFKSGLHGQQRVITMYTSAVEYMKYLRTDFFVCLFLNIFLGSVLQFCKTTKKKQAAHETGVVPSGMGTMVERIGKVEHFHIAPTARCLPWIEVNGLSLEFRSANRAVPFRGW